MRGGHVLGFAASAHRNISRAVRRNSNLGIVALPASTEGHSCGLHNLRGQRLRLLHALHGHELSPEAPRAIQEVAEPGNLLGSVLAVLLALHVVQVVKHGLDSCFVPSKLAIELHESLHRTSFLQAVLDRNRRGLVGLQHRLGHMPRLHNRAVYAKVDLPLLEGPQGQARRCPCRLEGRGDEEQSLAKAKREQDSQQRCAEAATDGHVSSAIVSCGNAKILTGERLEPK
mmetsp:Transcript_63716/g.149355  ORF Transcript_63716/g.149355 Transcript_63716/m.149355 type:complete len:229 (-) Transcript_63716:18-704(-)